MNRQQLIPANRPRHTDHAVLVMGIALMLAGAAMLVADVVSSGIAIPLIAVGIALVAIEQVGARAG